MSGILGGLIHAPTARCKISMTGTTIEITRSIIFFKLLTTLVMTRIILSQLSSISAQWLTPESPAPTRLSSKKPLKTPVFSKLSKLKEP